MGSDGEHSTGTAFLLWLACVFGLCGVHRFYLGKPFTGFLYLISFGFFGVGQAIDLIRLKGMVEDENLRHQAFQALHERRALERVYRPLLPPAAPSPAEEEDIKVALTRAAAKNAGSISVTQGVLATGRDFAEVETALDEMTHSGYVGIDNDPDSGVVIYTFRELLP